MMAATFSKGAKMKTKKQSANTKRSATQNKSVKTSKHINLPAGSSHNNRKSHVTKPMFNPLAGP
jgi:hypothetical protein